jgi:hypothetical protein
MLKRRLNAQFDVDHVTWYFDKGHGNFYAFGASNSSIAGMLTCKEVNRWHWS